MMIDKRLVLIAGFRKSGTTSLHDVIASHPSVDEGKYKEPQFLSLEPQIIKSNLDWYKKLYNLDRNVIVDGSTWCLYSPWLPRLLKSLFSDVKVIILVRDPAIRAHSAYKHMWRKVPKVEKRPFKKIISDMEKSKEEESIYSRESRILEKAASSGLVKYPLRTNTYHKKKYGANFRTSLHDENIELKYFTESTYSTFIPNFESALGDNLKIVVMEDLVNNTNDSLREIVEFLGLEKSGASSMPHSNKTREPKNKLIRRLISLKETAPGNEYLRKFDGLVKLWSLIRQNVLESPVSKMSENEYKRTREILRAEYDYWSERYLMTQKYWKYRSVSKRS